MPEVYEVENLERRTGVLLKNLELNRKKIRQKLLFEKRWDLTRLHATRAIVGELCELAELLESIYENPGEVVEAIQR